MAADPTSQVLRWVREGEQLFGQTLQTLHRCRQLEMAAEAVTKQNQSLQREIEKLRAELDELRAQRLETADSLKAFAEHVTQLATLILQGLAKGAK